MGLGRQDNMMETTRIAFRGLEKKRKKKQTRGHAEHVKHVRSWPWDGKKEKHVAAKTSWKRERVLSVSPCGVTQDDG